jgi:hypothetical protein
VQGMHVLIGLHCKMCYKTVILLDCSPDILSPYTVVDK